MGERQSITQKGVRAIDARNSQLCNGSNPEGPKTEKIQPRLKFSISLENFNLD